MDGNNTGKGEDQGAAVRSNGCGGAVAERTSGGNSEGGYMGDDGNNSDGD